MTTNIFSTYSTGENRVTASIIAVLQRLSLSRIERLLGALLEQSEFELVRFQNQPSRGGEGVPDAIIQSSCHILFETKIKCNAVKVEQLQVHLQRLEKSAEATRLLLVLTPDTQRPPAINEIDSPMLVWAPFAALDQAINEMLDDPQQVVSEREEFFLRELQAMLEREKLIGAASDVVVVAAKHAWPEYQKYHAYVCQPDRAFQSVKRMAFYSQGQVYPLVPRIRETHEHVVFARGGRTGELGRLVDIILVETRRKEHDAFKVMLLSATDSEDTIDLGRSIPNDLISSSGRTTAFTQSQCYVSLERLKSARTTSDLVGP